MNPMNVAVLLTALVASARSEGFHNGPVTFGSDLAHPNGAKSYATITLGASGALNSNTASRNAVTTSGEFAPLSQPQQFTIQRSEPSVHFVQDSSPQFSVYRSAPQVSYVQSSAPQFSLLQSSAPQYQFQVPQQQIQLFQSRAPQISVYERQAPQLSVYQAPAQQIRIQQAPAAQIRVQQAPATQVRVQQQRVAAVSGPATSHGYTVNAPGLTKTATFGYPSGRTTITNSAPRVTVTQQSPRVQVRVDQPQVQVLQAPAPQIRIQQAPQLSVLQAPAPQIRIQQAPAPQIRVQQAPATRFRVEQPRVSVSGPATSHGYTVNAPGLTKTATFGYPSGGVSISQAAQRVTVQEAPKVQVRVAQPQLRVVQAPAPQIRIQQAPAPQIRIQQAAAPQIRIQQAPAPQVQVLQAPAPQYSYVQDQAPQIRVQQQQSRVAVSGPATSHGYTVNAPGLTKTATFGYPSGGVSVTQAAPRVTVSEAPKIQLRVAQPQFQYVQAEAPQVHLVSSPQPRVSVVHSPAPQVSLVHHQVSPVSTLTYGAPQISVIRTQQPQYQYIPVSAPQISFVRSAQPQVQIEHEQQEERTIQVESPRVSATVSGYTAPNVRQQQFNTPSHGYQVSAPGFTKHKTFAGPSVYGTHQDSGISGASGIGHVDFSLRKDNKSSA
ncbi:MAGE-like protein 2 [Galendromus occidentalis]|uniref:MAGE-like protein 2 n=1 Tax=Galendromus occidentalis TaxID=34638 RepID=A0AAJ7WH22_9ACAR|nr:MAGE-like protein 2 [Galendromus occidentalis]